MRGLTTKRRAIALWGSLGLALVCAVGAWASHLTAAFESSASAVSTGVVQLHPNDAYLAPRPTPTFVLTPGGQCQKIRGVTGDYVYLSVKTGSLLSPAQVKNC